MAFIKKKKKNQLLSSLMFRLPESSFPFQNCEAEQAVPGSTHPTRFRTSVHGCLFRNL